MGERFAALPATLREMHSVLRDGGASGEAVAEAGRNAVARLIARLFGFPPPGMHNLHVAFAESSTGERWTRDFGGRLFSSVLTERAGLLVERFGPLYFGFELPSDSSGLAMVMRRWWLGPLPLPLFLAPRAEAREWEEGGRFHFDVAIALPLIGRIVRYRGWLISGERQAAELNSSVS